MTKTKRLGTVLCCVLMIVMVLGAFAVSAASATTIIDLANGSAIITNPGDYMIVGSYTGSEEVAVQVAADANITLAYVSTNADLVIGNPGEPIDVTVTLVGINSFGEVSVEDGSSYSNDSVTVNGSGALNVAGNFYVAAGGVLDVSSGNFAIGGTLGGSTSGRHVGTIYLNGGVIEAGSIENGTHGYLYFREGVRVFTGHISTSYGDLYISGGYIETRSISQGTTAGGVFYISPLATIIYI